MFSGADSAIGGAVCATFITSRPPPLPACPGHADRQALRSSPRMPMPPPAGTPGLARRTFPLTIQPCAPRRIGYACCTARGQARPVSLAEMGTVCPGRPACAGQRVRRNRYALRHFGLSRSLLARRSGYAQKFFFEFDSADGSGSPARIPPTYPQSRARPTTQKRVRLMLQRNNHRKP